MRKKIVPFFVCLLIFSTVLLPVYATALPPLPSTILYSKNVELRAIVKMVADFLYPEYPFSWQMYDRFLSGSGQTAFWEEEVPQHIKDEIKNNPDINRLIEYTLSSAYTHNGYEFNFYSDPSYIQSDPIINENISLRTVLGDNLAFSSGDLSYTVHGINGRVVIDADYLGNGLFDIWVALTDLYDFTEWFDECEFIYNDKLCYANNVSKMLQDANIGAPYTLSLGFSFSYQDPDFHVTGESPDVGGATSGSTSSGVTYVENQYYRNPNATFTEGYYTGEWKNGAPNGYGKIVYADMDGDGNRYSVSTDSATYYATSYEGYFSDGLRYGEGTVYYEGGYKDEGSFYGAWAADKLVFEGKRWQCTDNVNGYCPWSIIAADTVSPKVENHGDWVSVKTSYTVSYNANGGSGAPGQQTKTYGKSLTLRSQEPTRSGYTFQGWATSSGGSAVYQPGSSYANDADLTLYAVWKKTAADSFDDVQQGSWFYDAVSWAGQQNITQGTALRTFSPELACTRGQAVTFLWRAAGCPREASANPFTDVSKDDYYYAAVLWAKNSGITYGVTNDTFAPELMVNRAQFATMLYRFAGSAPVYGSTGFRDIPQGSYYADAVKWCASYGITNGTTKTTFSPEQVCTRAQIVTFLFRFCNP